MSRLGRYVWPAVIILLVIAGFFIDFMRFGGQFRELKPLPTTQCRSIELPGSAEDLQLDRSRGLAYLSVLDRRGLVEGRSVSGQIMRLDLNDAANQATSAAISLPPNFRPHGMSLYRMGDGAQRLFVISHPPDAPHTIEIFEQRSNGLFQPVDTILNELLVSPNAIVGVGPRQFYVANDKGAGGLLTRLRELLFRQGFSTITYFDGEQMRIVASGLKTATGMTMSPDGLKMYVAETLGRRVAVFDRNTSDGSLRLSEYITVDGAPDNLQVDPEGALWIAAHPKLLDLVRHFGDPDHPAPTRIIRYRTRPDAPLVDDRVEIRDMFLDLGQAVSAGSVGTPFGGQLLIGSITEPKVLTCRLPDIVRPENSGITP
ncbi:MAG: SMP-30/gluconolactonase/LRE family protein [Steroidobacteraceae bacterium]